MTRSHTSPDSTERIAQEHHEIRRALVELERTSGAQAVIAGLERLLAMLVQHFADEEARDGLHEVIGDAAPHCLDQLDRLLRDHQLLLGATRALIERIRVEQEDCSWRPAVAELIDQLRAHEDCETEMLSRAVSTDLGGSG